MKISNISEDININLAKSVLTVGTFDGVHKGHRKIIDKLISAAKKHNAESVLLTFQPHPRKIIFPDDKNLILINTPEEKAKLLKKTGIDRLIIMPFTKEFSQLSSCEFIEQIVFKKLNAKHLIVGYDHRFGKDRLGDFEKLKQCTLPFGIDVEKVDVYMQNGENISSTKIRNAILQGNIQKANDFLSYKFYISGKVTKGQGIGRKLGFPTANILIKNKEKLLPKNGVYSVDVEIDKRIFAGMINIGNNPTVKSDSHRNIEVNIFDFDNDIYNKDIAVFFNRFIRNEIKFNNLQELRIQLLNDKRKITSEN